MIDTDPYKTTEAGGHWWDVAVPEVSERPKVRAARKAYEKAHHIAARWRLESHECPFRRQSDWLVE